MKKTWNAPVLEELTIKATAGYGKTHGDKGRGDKNYGDKGYGDSDKCRCEGGTSPCSKHHGWDFGSDESDELS